ncbi:MAG: hypothetical protein WC003_13625, partial [Terrimicrobiaceae bacterium]
FVESPLHQIKPLRYRLQVAGAIFHIGTIAETPCCIKLFLDDSQIRVTSTMGGRTFAMPASQQVMP